MIGKPVYITYEEFIENTPDPDQKLKTKEEIEPLIVQAQYVIDAYIAPNRPYNECKQYLFPFCEGDQVPEAIKMATVYLVSDFLKNNTNIVTDTGVMQQEQWSGSLYSYYKDTSQVGSSTSTQLKLPPIVAQMLSPFITRYCSFYV